jgi:hypothetical protein
LLNVEWQKDSPGCIWLRVNSWGSALETTVRRATAGAQSDTMPVLFL